MKSKYIQLIWGGAAGGAVVLAIIGFAWGAGLREALLSKWLRPPLKTRWSVA